MIENMKHKCDECGVVAFYGLHVQREALSLFYDELLQWFNKYGARPNKLAVEGDGYSGKTGAFSRIDSQLRERGFRGIESISVFSMSSDGTIPILDWNMTAEVSLKPSCAVFSGHSSFVDETAMLDIARQAVVHLKPDYGIGYWRESRLGPVMYAMGISHGINSFSGPEYEEGVKISRWTEGMNENVYCDGLLRDIYPYNFLTDEQTSRNVGNVTLARWIQEDSKRGRLIEFQDHVSLWLLNESEITYVREVLERGGFIF